MTANSSSPETAQSATNIVEYSVGEIARQVKRALEGSFERVRVRGEVSRPNYHSSGHLYFTIKDEDAVLDGVCWRGNVARLGLTLEEGMEVVCTGRISSYPKSSRYQIVVEAVELAGVGALLKLLEKRRKKLAAEGLFDQDRKQELPFLPDVIGVVTSPTGAVIRDILHRLDDRFPRHVILWPVPVQGETAAKKIAAAIDGFNVLVPFAKVPRPDVLIVGRGGGSLEDLWPFNEEVVVRAAASSDIPLISAVGHETDTTLIDFAADVRAPTPTAAAEMAVPVRADLLAEVMDNTRRMTGAANRMWDEHRMRLDGLGRGLPEPVRLLEQAMQQLDRESDRLRVACSGLFRDRAQRLSTAGAALRSPAELLVHAGRDLGQTAKRLSAAIRPMLRDAVQRLDTLDKLLHSLSYKGVLARGFALVRDSAGAPVFSAAQAVPGSEVDIEFSDGAVAARLKEGGKKKSRSKKTPELRAKSGGDDPQGSLL